MITEKWEAMPMLGSPLWGVKDDKGVVLVLGLTEELARLIAAAPDLLAMLKRYRKETPLGNQPHMIAGKADLLIAKAEGNE